MVRYISGMRIYLKFIYGIIFLSLLGCADPGPSPLENAKNYVKESRSKRREIAAKFFRYGQEDFNRKNYESAGENYLYALKYDSSWWEPCYGLALTSVQTRQFETALEFISLAFRVEYTDDLVEKLKKDKNLDPLRRSSYGKKLDAAIARETGLHSLNDILNSEDAYYTGPFLTLRNPDVFRDPRFGNIKYLDHLVSIFCLDCLREEREMRFLALPPNVKGIVIDSGVIDGSGLKYLTKLKQLELLDLNAPGLKGANLRFLRSIPTLTKLELTNFTLDEEALSQIAAIELDTLILRSTAISVRNLKKFADRNQLRYLEIYDSRITDDHLCQILSMDLDELNLNKTPIGDRGTDCILKMKKSSHLLIIDGPISPENMERIKAMPSLRVVFL